MKYDYPTKQDERYFNKKKISSLFQPASPFTIHLSKRKNCFEKKVNQKYSEQLVQPASCSFFSKDLRIRDFFLFSNLLRSGVDQKDNLLLIKLRKEREGLGTRSLITIKTFVNCYVMPIAMPRRMRVSNWQ